MTVPFIDLARIHQPLKEDLLKAVEKAIDAGDFVPGPALRRFEESFARRMGVAHAVGVGSSADAIYLTLHALGLQPGDEVICPAYGDATPAAAAARVGATVIFADVDEDGLINVEQVRALAGERTRAVIAVHLFGRAVDVATLGGICADLGIHLIEDVSHAAGAAINGRALGSFGTAGTFNFHPSNSLGALGEGGLVLTANQELAERLRLYRNGGIDANGRLIDLDLSRPLDSLQAALLEVKLVNLDEDMADRTANADFYREQLGNNAFGLPPVTEESAHAYSSFVIRHPQRDQLRNFLRDRQVETRVPYDRPLPLEPFFEYLGYQPGHFPVAELLSAELLALPIMPGLTRKELDEVAHAMGLYAQTFPATTTGG